MKHRSAFAVMLTAATCLLAACTMALPLPTAAPTVLPTSAPTITARAVSIATVVPVVTAAEGTATPTAASEVKPTATLLAQSDAVKGQPWKDCAVAVGWVGCDPQQPAAAVQMAFVNAAGPALVQLHLSSDKAWWLPVKPLAMEWSPDGSQLWVQTAENDYQVYSNQGVLLDQFTAEIPPRWQLNGRLGRDGHIYSSMGDDAWAVMSEDYRWTLNVLSAGQTDAKEIVLERQASDRLYDLLTWIPNTTRLIGQHYVAGNSAIMQGAQLFEMDTRTGAVRDLSLYSPIDGSARFAWSSDGRWLALLESKASEGGPPTLALWDAAADEVHLFVPLGVQIGSFAWSPQGDVLAFAAEPLGQIEPLSAARVFTQQGIYQLTAQDGLMKALTQPQRDAHDDMPFWSSDGSSLFYARYREVGVLETHGLRVAEKQDWLVATGLPVNCEDPQSGCLWQSWIAWGQDH